MYVEYPKYILHMIPSQDTSHNIAGRRSSSEGDISQAAQVKVALPKIVPMPLL